MSEEYSVYRAHPITPELLVLGNKNNALRPQIFVVRRSLLSTISTERASSFGTNPFRRYPAKETASDEMHQATLIYRVNRIQRRRPTRVLCSTMTAEACSLRDGISHLKSSVAANAPASCAPTNPAKSVYRMPENVFVTERASVTAGLANEVEAVNQYAALI